MRRWMEMNVPRRILSLALSAAMVLSLLPVFAIAEGDCPHHREHTPECGYVKAVEGQDCGHVCGDECYTDTTDCKHNHDESCYSDGQLPAEGEEKAADACTHVCSEESGCVTRNHACVHTAHDEACGYVEAVAGQPCGFVCTECGAEESKPIPPEEKVIADWEWVDDYEIIDPDSGEAALPFASAENVAQFDDILALLPAAIMAQGEALALGDWVCPDFPVETGAYEGTYVFETTLPEGFVLDDGANVLRLTVVLGDPEGAPAAVLAITPAEPPTGTHILNGTSYSDVYELSTPAHLYWFANHVNSGNTTACAIVMNDITVNSGVLNGDGSLNTSGSFESWTPIGDTYRRYSGTFDGNGNTISGLYVNDESTSVIGLFGVTDTGGTLVNVTIADSYFAGVDSVGGVCGNNLGTVLGCANSGNVTGSGDFIGGVCGGNYGTVSNCTNSGTVTGRSCVGGVCGNNYQGSVSSCTSTGTVSGNNSVGGVCGNNYQGSVSSCYFDNTAYTGNAVGYNDNGTVTDVRGKSPAEFASGEVAYLLNGSTSEGTLVWYQNIDKTGVTRDPYPKFTGATVYKTSDVSPCQGYTNNSNRVRAHNLQNHACTYCGYWETVLLTVSGIAAQDKVYDGGVTAQLDFTNARLNGVLSAYPNVSITATGAFANADVGQNKPVTISGLTLTGADAPRYRLADSGHQASTTASITAKPVTLTVTVKDKPFDGTTTAEIDTVTTGGFVKTDDVQVVNGTAAFVTAYPYDYTAVSFTEFTLTGSDAGNYQLTQPTGVTGKIKPSPRYLNLTNNAAFARQNEVWIDGVKYPVMQDNGRYVALPESGDLLIIYTYKKGDSAASQVNYPTGMAVYRIDRQASGATVAKIDALDDLLQYSGCSIRITGKRGIRMITSLTKGNKSALTGSGLAGYTLEEYGTVVQWADTLGSNSLTLTTGKSNYAYKKGLADPVFSTTGDLTQYTNVLVWESLTDAQLGQDIVMRPYIILRDGSGNTVTLYGGCVSRSIGYIAYQNRNAFQPGSAAYEYVWSIIHNVYGDQYDNEYRK